MYAWSFTTVYFLMLCGIVAWSFAGVYLENKNIWRIINSIFLIISVYGILKYTVLGRSPSDEHLFIVFSDDSNEFWRELLMNLFLYFPAGLTLAHLLKRYWLSVLLLVLLSLGIEYWQYSAGTGTAQLTDFVCNSLGAMIGGISFLITAIAIKYKHEYNSL